MRKIDQREVREGSPGCVGNGGGGRKAREWAWILTSTKGVIEKDTLTGVRKTYTVDKTTPGGHGNRCFAGDAFRASKSPL